MSFEHLPEDWGGEYESHILDDEFIDLEDGYKLIIDGSNQDKTRYLLLAETLKEVVGSCDVGIDGLSAELGFLGVHELFQHQGLGGKMYIAIIGDVITNNPSINTIQGIFINPYSVRIAAKNVPEGWSAYFIKKEIKIGEPNEISLEEAQRITIEDGEDPWRFSVQVMVARNL